MALHTNVGLGDFVLMDDISMNPFLQNLKIRYVYVHNYNMYNRYAYMYFLPIFKNDIACTVK